MKSGNIFIILVLFLILTTNKVFAQWSDVGGGTDAIVLGMCEFNDQLFTAGYYFDPQPMIATPFDQCWYDENWHLTSGLNSNFTFLTSLKIYNNTLYLGGDFGVEKWNGVSWDGSLSYILSQAMEQYDNKLYTGGNDLRFFDGVTWNLASTGSLLGIEALSVFKGELYACGFFTQIDGITFNHIAKWNGSAWSAVESGLPNFDRLCMAVYNNELYIGGNFLASQGYPSDYIMKWNDTTWLPVGIGANGPVTALDSAYGHLFAGGDFTSIDSVDANHIAEYDGQWHAMSTGLSPSYVEVNCIYPYHQQIYVGGKYMQEAGGIAVSNIARWGNYVGEEQLNKEKPMAFCVPNPFSVQATIEFNLPQSGITSVIIYDELGREISLPLDKEYLPAGDHHIEFNGAGLQAGVYLFQIQNNGLSAIGKMILSK